MITYRLLLVDDDDDIHLIYKSTLQHLPVSFDDALDGGEALGLLKKNTYDLILLDLVMPEVNGFEFLDKVQEQKLSLPFVIVCSSMREKEIVMAAFQLGASDFLFKPIQPKQLRTTVQTYLDTLSRSQSDFSNLKSLVENEIGYVANRSIGASSPASAAVLRLHRARFTSIPSRERFPIWSLIVKQGNLSLPAHVAQANCITTRDACKKSPSATKSVSMRLKPSNCFCTSMWCL
jgi:Response regulator containing CheY-like receiver, AAA-type ATPase, and DNA-binding domains